MKGLDRFTLTASSLWNLILYVIISNTDSTSSSTFFEMPYENDVAKVKRSGLMYFYDNFLVSLEVAIIFVVPAEVATFSKH